MANGTIPLGPGILQRPTTQSNSATGHKSAAKRTAQPRLKLLIRRLPPGLTENEFVTALGPEWKVGAGKIDWFVYRHGKISKDPAKPSRPARAYVHVVEVSLVAAISDKIRQTTFQDAKNTTRDLALLGPPAVEFAPYTKIPASRKRKDARQGTIDQDPEFMSFLNSLTDPIQKPAVDLEPAPKPEKWVTTPLIDHLREKKAKKDKPAVSKSNKKDTKDAAKAKSKESPTTTTALASGSEKSKKPAKTAKTKESVKVLNRPDKSSSPAASPSSNTEKSSANKEAVKSTVPERKRERPAAPFSLAAKIQRDLGLSPAPRRSATAPKENAASHSSVSTTEAKQEEQVATGSSTKPANASNTPAKREIRGRDRRNSKPPKAEAAKADFSSPAVATNQPSISNVNTKTTNSPSTGKEQGQSTSNTASRAFLKHANASQGVTEALLKTTLTTFGPVSKVEIDPKKGTAFADFETTQGLAAAVAKGKVEVAKATVIIAEYRERPARAQRTNNPAPSASSASGGQSVQSGSNAGNEAGRGRAGRGGRGGRGRAAPSQTHSPRTASATKQAPTTTSSSDTAKASKG